MKNVAKWLRVKAAKNDRSVSTWLAELIEGIQRQEDKYDVAMKSRTINRPDGRKPTRADGPEEPKGIRSNRDRVGGTLHRCLGWLPPI